MAKRKTHRKTGKGKGTTYAVVNKIQHAIVRRELSKVHADDLAATLNLGLDEKCYVVVKTTEADKSYFPSIIPKYF